MSHPIAKLIKPPYICVKIQGPSPVGVPVLLYQTDAVQAFPTATFGKVQFEEPSSIIPLPALFLAILPFSIVALLALSVSSFHIPEPL